MKKLFTIDDFIIAFISALVYGLSFEIPILLGWGIWTALTLCLIIGGAIDALDAFENNSDSLREFALELAKRKN